jgi:hypothetical protein
MSPQPASAGVVHLHIGEPKTGTTYLQQVLWTNRARLLERGLLIPGKRPSAHWAAAQDLRQAEEVENDPFGPMRGAWDRLAAEALAAPRAAVISQELLAAVDAEQAARAVASLQPAEVHIVLTVRDIATLLPAEWQETVKHRNTRPWREWLGAVIDEESVSPDRRRWWFWRVHDTLEILRIWSAVVPAQRLHVVTVPAARTEPDLLWRRFAQVIGIDPAIADAAPRHGNRSLRLPEVEFLRRLNLALPERYPDWLYVRSIKDGLAHDAFAGRADGDAERLYLPRERDEWARTYAESLVAGLRASAYDVVGDPDELLPPPLPEQRPDPSDVADSQLVAAALDAAVGLAAQVAAGQGVSLEQRAPGAPARPPGRVKRALLDLSRRSPAVHRLRRRYWDVANVARRLRAGDGWRAVEDRDISDAGGRT